MPIVSPALLLAVAASAGTPITPRLVVRDHTVSAKLHGVPLPAVLARLSEASGAALTGEAADSRDVTLTLRRVPFEEALKRLLRTQSFTLTYDGDGGLKRITLGGAARETSASTAGATGRQEPPATSADQAKEAVQPLARFLQANRLVRVSGRVARFLGTNVAPFGDVLQAALKSEDAQVRARARRIMVQALTEGPEVRGALVAMLGPLPDDKLAALLRGGGGVDAQALAEAFARYGRSVELTRAMQRALAQMRAQPVGRPAHR